MRERHAGIVQLSLPILSGQSFIKATHLCLAQASGLGSRRSLINAGLSSTMPHKDNQAAIHAL
jgi:hypothetical protein